MKYRDVIVCTTCNKNNIQGSFCEFQHNGDVATATRDRVRDIDDHWVCDGVGMYARDQEKEISLVIPETSVWYDRVSHQASLHEEHGQAWDALVNNMWAVL